MGKSFLVENSKVTERDGEKFMVMICNGHYCLAHGKITS